MVSRYLAEVAGAAPLGPHGPFGFVRRVIRHLGEQLVSRERLVIRLVDAGMERMTRGYLWSLRHVLRFRRTMLVFTLALIGLTVWLYVIIFLGPIGALAYIGMEVVPDLGLLRQSFDAFGRRKRIVPPAAARVAALPSGPVR